MQMAEKSGPGSWKRRNMISTDKYSSFKSRSVVWCFTTHVQCVVCVDGYCCVHTLTAGRREAAPLGGEESREEVEMTTADLGRGGCIVNVTKFRGFRVLENCFCKN